MNLFLKNVERYKLITREDRLKLLSQASLETGETTKYEETLGKLETSDPVSVIPEDSCSDLIARELKRVRDRWNRFKRVDRKIAATVADGKYFMGIDPNKDPEPFEIRSSLFSEQSETASLVEDVSKASRYEDLKEMLECSMPKSPITSDRFIDVMTRAIEKAISSIERPVLMNELSDYESAYAMKRAAVRNLLLNRCTRNSFEETRIDKFMDSQIGLYRQRFNAPVPPEVVEPLVAFSGISYYSFCPLKRLEQKLDGIKTLLDGIRQGNQQVFEELPEFKSREGRYPFRNYYGFKSKIPKGVTGSIKMGKEVNEEEIRYPNLQCVAHSLPKDQKYRSIVSHAIRVLERSRGWDHASKIKAVNRLIDVYNYMASSGHYSSTLDKAIPLVRRKKSIKRTASRRDVFCKGLNYIPSLHRNHWNRTVKK